MAEEENKEEGQEEEQSGGGKKKLLIIIIAVVLLLGGGAAFFLLGGKEEGEEHQEEVHEEVHYERADFGVFVVNLSDNASFLKVHLIVEYDPNLIGAGEGGGHGGRARQQYNNIAYGGGGEGGEEGLPGIFGEKEPVIRDAIISVISSKTAEELLTSEGKERLKEELIEAINEAVGLEEEPVVAVYFTEFLIQ